MLMLQRHLSWRQWCASLCSMLRARLILTAVCSLALGVIWWGVLLPTPLQAQTGNEAPSVTAEQEKELERAKELEVQTIRLKEQGKYQEAIPLAKEALAIRRRVLGEEHADTATALHNLAYLYDDMGEYSEAMPLYRQSLAIRRRVLREEHPDTAITLNNLALVFESLSEYGNAEQLHLQSLAIKRKVLGEFHESTATSFNNLANLYRNVGEYGRAAQLFQQSLDMFRQVGGPENLYTASALNNLAGLYTALGEYGKAEPMYQQSLAILQRVVGDAHPFAATSMNNIAALYSWMGEYEKSKPLLHTSSEIVRRLRGSEHPDYASSVNNMAMWYYMQRDYLNAEPLFQQTLALTRQLQGEQHRNTASSLGNLAGLYSAIGEYEKADSLYQQSLTVYRQVLGAAHPDTLNTLVNLGHLYLIQHQPTPALSYATQSLTSSIDHLPKALPALSGPERLRYLQRLRGRVNLFLTATAEAKVPALDAWTPLLRVKGQSLLLEAGIARLEQSPDQNQRALLYDLRGLTARVSALERADNTSPELETTRSTLAEVEKKVTAIVAAQVPPTVDPQTLLRQLSPTTALIDFHAYDHLIPPPAPGQPETWERRAVAFVVRPDHEIQRVELGAESLIAEPIARWREGLTTIGSPSPTDSGQSLRARLWEPLEPYLKGISTVLISPDGALSLLPFGALPGKTPGHILLEDYAFVLAPVPQLLVQSPASPPAAQGAPSLLALGAVDYGASPGATSPEQVSRSALRSANGTTFDTLKDSGPELEAIVRLFHARWPAAPVARFTGDGATERAVKPALAHHSLLHFSTHGFVFPDPTDRAPARRPDMMIQLEGLAQGSVIDPRSRAGLALTGANHPLELGQDDGTLTALEVTTLDLRRVDLVVMSACESAIGTDARGEGMLGLQRAFQAAGAKTIVSSLWKVSDVATRALMERFYHNLWEKKLSRLEALREAQLWMMREGKRVLDPRYQGLRGRWLKLVQPELLETSSFYWAAFQLAGEWR